MDREEFAYRLLVPIPIGVVLGFLFKASTVLQWVLWIVGTIITLNLLFTILILCLTYWLVKNEEKIIRWFKQEIVSPFKRFFKQLLYKIFHPFKSQKKEKE